MRIRKGALPGAFFVGGPPFSAGNAIFPLARLLSPLARLLPATRITFHTWLVNRWGKTVSLIQEQAATCWRSSILWMTRQTRRRRVAARAGTWIETCAATC